MEHPFDRGFGFIANSNNLSNLQPFQTSHSLHRQMHGNAKSFFRVCSVKNVFNIEWTYEGTAEQHQTTRKVIFRQAHISAINDACDYTPKYIAVSYRWNTDGQDQILSNAQMQRLVKGLAYLSQGENVSFILWFDRVFTDAVSIDEDWAWKGTDVYRNVTSIMLDPPGHIMTKAGMSFWIFVEHALAGTQQRRYLQCYDNHPVWKTLANCDPAPIIFAVLRFFLTSHGKGVLRWGGAYNNQLTTLFAFMGDVNQAFEQQHINTICKFVFQRPSRCFKVLPDCLELSRRVSFATIENIRSCAGQVEMVSKERHLYIQFPRTKQSFEVEHICGIVYHVKLPGLELQPGAPFSGVSSLVFGQFPPDADVRSWNSSPWTKHKLNYLDKRPYGLLQDTWNTQFMETITGFQGFKISIRNLQPFALVRRGAVMFYVDPFSIDAGERGYHPLLAYKSNLYRHDDSNGDLAAWKAAEKTKLLDEIESKCGYKLVLHRGVWKDTICILEFGRVSTPEAIGSPSESLKPMVSNVLDAELNLLEYMDVSVTLKYVIHKSINDIDMEDTSLQPLYKGMKTVNEELNSGKFARDDNVDWLMAAKVMQLDRRDGRFRWAAAIGKALYWNTKPKREESNVDRYNLNPYAWKVASRLFSDIFFRDFHRIAGILGGIITSILGATRSEYGTLTAGITIIIASLSAGTKKSRGGKRSATRELILNNDCSFIENSGGVARLLKEDEDMYCAALEVGTLEFLGFKFRYDVAGNIMCVRKNKEVIGGILSGRSLRLDRAAATDMKLLRNDAALPRDMLVGRINETV